MLFMEKNELRKFYKNRRLGIADKKAKSKMIMERIISSSHYKFAHVIAVYASLPLEVDTSFLIEQAFIDHKVVVFPKVEGSDMAFYKITSVCELSTEGPLKIKEPISSFDHLVRKNEIDLMVVPGICFDKKNYRIGYGKGFYDRYLRGCKAHSIGVCFTEQIYDGCLPINEQDIAVNEVFCQ